MFDRNIRSLGVACNWRESNLNIFYLDKDPSIAASLQCNSHVVKMLLESAQMLSTAHRVLDGKEQIIVSSKGRKNKYWFHPKLERILYKPTHVNHPCNVWIRQSIPNYKWLYEHFVALAIEFEYRFEKVHMSFEKLNHVLARYPENIPRCAEFTDPPLAMKNQPQCIDESDPVGSYRKFYCTKDFNMTWTKRPIPDWYSNSSVDSETKYS